jgi:hypothetical protein
MEKAFPGVFASLENAGLARVITSEQLPKSIKDGRFSKAQTETEEFKKWFGDSKVVDSDGKPLVVYHGTKDDITKFDKRKSRTNKAFFFATDRGFASSPAYTGSIGGRAKGGGNVMPVYLSIKNPLVLDDLSYNPMFESGVIDKARNAGHDGIHVTKDGRWIAFEPKQIKSAIGNRGTFDPNNPDILYSKSGHILAYVQNGQVTFVADNISKGHNVKGLMLHEIGVHLKQLGKNDKEFQGILNAVRLMHKAKNAKVKAAYDRAYSAIERGADKAERVKTDLFWEEVAGYLTETNPDMSVAKRLVSWFRAKIREWASNAKGRDRLKLVQWANNLSDSDIVYMATEAVRAAKDAGTIAQNDGVRASMVGEYGGEHRPMTDEGGAARLHDLEAAFGEDIYGPNALQYYGSGDPREKAVVRILKSLKGNPDAEVTIYRGGPESIDGINPGDWVTLIESVAQDYADQSDGGKVVKKTVKASEVTSWADSLLEFGYYPNQSPRTEGADTRYSFDQPYNYSFTESDYHPAVVSWAKERFGDQVAPNGKPAWQNFTRWFGDSAVVDAEGKPLVVKHGSREEFTEFRGKRGGMYFTEDGAAVTAIFTEDGRGDIGEYYLSLKNPLDARWMNMSEAHKAELRLIIESVVDESDIEAAAAKLEVPIEDADPFEVFTDGEFFWGYGRDLQDAVMEAIKRRGYDGVIFPDALTMGEAHISYVVFNPEQIKSATGNTGDFSTDTWDIRYSRGVEAEQESFRPIRSGIRDRLDAIRFQIQDKLIDLKRAQEGVDTSDDANPYQKAAIWEGKAGERLNDFDEGRVQPLLEKVAESGLTLDQVGEWLVARHAREANSYLAEINPDKPADERYRLSGMSNDEAVKIMAEHAGNASLSEIGRMVDQINKDRVDMLVEEGLITKEMADQWRGRYKHYVPLNREEAEGGDHLPSRGQGFNIKGKESKMRTGSAYWTPGKILSHTIANMESSIVRAEKNQVGKALLAFIEQNPDDSFWTIETDRTMKSVRNGKVVEGPRLWDAPHEMTVKRDGVEYVIAFNPSNERAMRLVSGMKNLQAAQMGTVMRAMAKVTRFLASVNTSWNPEFMISNFLRDVQTAAYNLSDTEISDMKGRVLKDIPKAMNGIRSALFGDGSAEWAEVWEDFRKHGGKTGWLDIHSDIKAKERDLTKMVDRLQKGKPSRGAFVRFLNAVEGMNNVIENGVRLAAYKNALDAGLSKDKAAALAKDLTVNFNRKGQSGPTINALYMFFNAAVQGNVRLLQAMANSKKGRRLAYATIGFAVFLDIMNRSLSGDDDDDENIYDTLPDYVKNHNIIIMGEKEPIVKIPAPWGYNVLHTIGQVIGEAATGERFNATDAAARVGISIIDAFNPVGSGTIAQVISPTITDPIVQMAENKSFSGAPLKPEHTFDAGRPKPEYLMHWSTAREMSKDIAEWLNDATGGNEVRPGAINVSPEWIDLIVDSATGGLGRLGANAMDVTTRLVTGEEIPTENTPFLRKVTGFNNEYGIKGRYYEWGRDVAYAKAERKTLKGDELREAGQKPSHKLIPAYEAAEKQLRNLRKLRRTLEQRGAPQERIDAIDARIREVMARFNKRYAEVMFN